MAGSASSPSTPSTVSSSVLALQSPNLGGQSPDRIEINDDHSHLSSSLVDSILEPTRPLTFASPARSVTHISPRTLFIAVDSSDSRTDDEDTRPLSEIQQRATTLPSHQSEESTTFHSPRASTLYESFTPSTEADTTAQHSPSLSLVEVPRGQLLHVPPQVSGTGRRTPGSTTSWSEVASDSGDEPEFLVASDNESWASISDRMA
jgi:hypothetical protein